MYATFNRFEIQMTRTQAESASHQGRCDEDVKILLEDPKIRRRLDKIDPSLIAAELREYGAWDDTELQDRQANRERITWIAACNITEELAAKKH